MRQSKFVRETHQLRMLHHRAPTIWDKIHIDTILLSLLLLLVILGLFILYSAGNESLVLINQQLIRFVGGFIILVLLAQVPPSRYYQWAPWLFAITLALLLIVLIVGHIGKGAQRWLALGSFHLQPAEMMKLTMPMLLAWYFHDRKLPPSYSMLMVSSLLIAIPALLVAKQPDLGTAIIIACSGVCVLFLAGMGKRLITFLGLLFVASTPLIWHFLHDYQRERVLTFINPERDPLGSGYHIIQSKIAIGSGGFFGKGWLNGTQSHLQFLPEHATDFIFAVCSEEFGLLGNAFLLTIFLAIIARCLYISFNAQDTFARLLSGSLSLTFFICVFVNIGMVSGILPVVGLPLPLVSYGGTSMVTLLAAFGLIMSISTHRKLLPS